MPAPIAEPHGPVQLLRLLRGHRTAGEAASTGGFPVLPITVRRALSAATWFPFCLSGPAVVSIRSPSCGRGGPVVSFQSSPSHSMSFQFAPQLAGRSTPHLGFLYVRDRLVSIRSPTGGEFHFCSTSVSVWRRLPSFQSAPRLAGRSTTGTPLSTRSCTRCFNPLPDSRGGPPKESATTRMRPLMFQSASRLAGRSTRRTAGPFATCSYSFNPLPDSRGGPPARIRPSPGRSSSCFNPLPDSRGGPPPGPTRRPRPQSRFNPLPDSRGGPLLRDLRAPVGRVNVSIRSPTRGEVHSIAVPFVSPVRR